jgi:DNA-3-methyladenine glycosylase II
MGESDRSRRVGKGEPIFDVPRALRHLRKVDPVLAGVMRRSVRYNVVPDGTQSLFHALAESIVYQQLSGKAAATIFGRFVDLYRSEQGLRPAGPPASRAAPAAGRRNGSLGRRRFPKPEEVLATPHGVLRSAGLSNNKALALKDLAAKTLDGTVPPLRSVKQMSDEELVERLTTVRGIGVWTVEMLLMFRLGRPDVLPVGDLGVRKGYMLAYGLDEMPTPKELLQLGEVWRPFRSVGSWYMWRACELNGNNEK